MSRLIDRILCDGVRELRASDVDPDWLAHEEIAPRLAEYRDDPFAVAFLRERLNPRFVAPDSEALVERLIGVPVFCADEVGRWCQRVPYGADAFDIVSVLAPPYPVFWVEVQGVANQLRAHAYGAPVSDISGQVAPGGDAGEGEDGARWHLLRELFIEAVKGRGARHAASYQLMLDASGRILGFEDARPGAGWLPRPVEGEAALSAETDLFLTRALAGLDFAVLMTISFLNCTNVRTRPVQAPGKLAAKHRRRHGRDPVSFHVLDIRPMTRALDAEGDIARNGLRRALHLCRGHFKTYGPERPLFGRTTGTFWWSDRARGSAEQGVTDEDYRVHPDALHR